MSEVTIKNPVINSPFDEPQRHFQFTERGITEDIVEGRRKSEYFIPMPKPKKQVQNEQMSLGIGEARELREANIFINRVRDQVTAWRKSGYPGVTPTTRRLLEHWNNPENEPRLFFCQREAVETAIYLNECERKNLGDSFYNQLKSANSEANPNLFRIAFKMATGTGKTVVMAMLIAYHTLNKIANKTSTLYSDTFLIVTPGVTIRDRLQVLMPENPDNDYQKMDLLPHGVYEALCQAKIVITNYHAFQTKKKESLSKANEKVLGDGAKNFIETPDEMVTRVCRSFSKKKNIIVLNDEAHHCYRRKQEENELTDDSPRLWISGLEAVNAKLGIRTVYDLSATPFFLSGSGYSTVTQGGRKLREGVLFPWVVSDFALIDAIECGIAKVPRVPVADDSTTDDPIYRRLWEVVRDKLKGIVTESEPQLPQELETALQSLYSNYEEAYDLWEKEPEGLTPPVMIVVCNNTKVSKLVYDWIAGWEKETADGQTVVVKGKLPIFNNEDNEKWSEKLNTVLIDSKQLESGEPLKESFKKAVKTLIEQFRLQKNVDKVTDEDLLREVLNTVGKKGKLGENIKCVVSVSMLSEGWDARRVTHILGVRAFSTQLLCEQVVGRGLRRSSHDVEKTTVSVDDEDITLEAFPAEYAEVYGVPFSFIPATGTGKGKGRRPVTLVESIPERKEKCEITFPIVIGYRRCFSPDKLDAVFDDNSRYVLSTEEIPSTTENQDITGRSIDIEPLYGEKYRIQETEYALTRLLLDTYLRDTDEDSQWWLFPQLLRITRRWMKDCVTYKDNTNPQFFNIGEIARMAIHRIYMGILNAEKLSKKTEPDHTETPKTFLPIFPMSSGIKGRTGTTSGVSFETTRPTRETKPDKCHISHVVADTESWEQKTSYELEQMNVVDAYVKNHKIGFTIPYINHNGESRQYVPDFIVRLKTENKVVHLILEVSGWKREDKTQKVNTVNNMWLPAINGCEEFGEWFFLEITDPWNTQSEIRKFLKDNAL